MGGQGREAYLGFCGMGDFFHGEALAGVVLHAGKTDEGDFVPLFVDDGENVFLAEGVFAWSGDHSYQPVRNGEVVES